MVKYQGSKQRYAGSIARVLLGLGPDWHRFPFWECCCGSAEVSFYISKYSNLVDRGPWGRFWDIMQHHKFDVLEEAKETITENTYEHWVKHAVNSPMPRHVEEWAYTFLALQREAFNGKPINTLAGYWKSPGLGKVFSFKKWMEGLERATKVRIESVHVVDVNQLNISGNANVYLDPDYEDTVGYEGRVVDVRSFIHRHPHCNIVVSHHTKLPGTWDKIVEITQSGRENFAKDNTEYLHIKRRSDAASDPVRSKIPEPDQPVGDVRLQPPVLSQEDGGS